MTLLKFDDVIELKSHLTTQCEQLGVMLNCLIGQVAQTTQAAEAALHAMSLIAQLWRHQNFNWTIFLPTETIVRCLVQSKKLSDFFNQLDRKGHATIKTDHLFRSHLRLYSCVQ